MVLGGLNHDVTFDTFDADSAALMIVAGHTKDTSVISTNYNSMLTYPVIMMLGTGGMIAHSSVMKFHDENYQMERVIALKIASVDSKIATVSYTSDTSKDYNAVF